nr:excalibur calcium-binding domain-containing protein [Glycomyces amatae]
MSTAEKVAVILVLAVPVLCCGGVLNMIDDDDPETETIAGEPTEDETSESGFELPSDRTTFYGSTEAPTSASPEPEPTTEEAAEEEREEAEEVYYENCDAARDAGVAPLYEDEDGYRSGLDGDGDGEACEDSSSSGGGGGSGGDDSGGGDDDDDDGGVYYENCDAARAAGAAPVYAGHPGYGSHLDRDGDGVACE